MDISIIQIGNSQGIRLPKTVLKRYDITDTVELVMEQDYIILKPKHTPRKGWDQAFKAMHEKGDDDLIMPDIFDDEIIEE